MDKVLHDIPDAGNYQITKDGEVYSKRTGKKMAFDFPKKRYLMVKVCINGKQKGVYIHRILAILFVPNPENKLQVNHINGVMTDNRIENLEWVTAKENIRHSYRIGLVDKKGKHNNGAKLNKEKVLAIRKMRAETNLTYKQIAEKFGVCAVNIGHIINRTTWYYV